MDYRVIFRIVVIAYILICLGYSISNLIKCHRLRRSSKEYLRMSVRNHEDKSIYGKEDKLC